MENEGVLALRRRFQISYAFSPRIDGYSQSQSRAPGRRHHYCHCPRGAIDFGEMEKGWGFEIYASNFIGIERYDDAWAALDQAEALVSGKRLPWVVWGRVELEKERGNLQAALEFWKTADSKTTDEGAIPEKWVEKEEEWTGEDRP